MRRLFSDLSQLACDSVFIRGAAVVFLCAAELFVRRAAAGVFFRRAVECSFVELLSGVFFRRAAVGVFFG